ncbi:MAG: pilus assembly PilX N-terminal domain-containing protein [Gammaproteobacteria bacterium]|nr:pilus assembly PilX N-terminal domain-containing protein [Gammaproteobacteria bacterium]
MSAARCCSGFTLISAIFLLVVLAALGVYMVTISGVQQATTSHAVIAARTYYAAKSGLEWAINRAVNTPAGSAVPLLSPCTNSTSTFTDASLPDINITITCSYSRHREGGTPGGGNNIFNVLVLTSTAEYGAFGNPDYASRRLEATVSNRYGPPE